LFPNSRLISKIIKKDFWSVSFQIKNFLTTAANNRTMAAVFRQRFFFESLSAIQPRFIPFIGLGGLEDGLTNLAESGLPGR
jgi:hypothetical protein